jgi:hypothetical protein
MKGPETEKAGEEAKAQRLSPFDTTGLFQNRGKGH